MKNYLEKLAYKQCLSKEEAYELMDMIANDRANQLQIAAVLGYYNSRPLSPDEFSGFRENILDLATKIDLFPSETIDVCGTGGDGKNSFNISTLCAFVLAGAGIPVTKHGNHGVSSISGSSTVLEFLGFKFTNDESKLNRQLEKAGICFLHAPLFHPALKNVAGIRKQLGVKTFFNLLGPVVNPSQPKCQLLGVYQYELLRMYSHLMSTIKKKYVVIYSLDGYDEFSLTGPLKLFSDQGEDLIHPETLGLLKIHADELYGGDDVASNAHLFISILKNEASESKINIVAANSALGIKCVYPELSYSDAFLLAKESIESAKAFNSFNQLKNLS